MTTEDEAKFMLVEGISLKEYIDKRVKEEMVKHKTINMGKYTADGTFIPPNSFISCDGDIVDNSERWSY